MSWWQWPFFLIGFIIVAVALLIAVAELVRAARQAVRVAYVVNRLDGLRGFKAKAWWRAFRWEFDSSYSSIAIGHFRIDRRLSVPIRRA